MEQTEYKIKLSVFEGPFDLLFHLIKKAEVDIWSVSIAEITEQYLDYLKAMEELNLDIASEFLVMAATLLRLKSKMLLPRIPSTDTNEEEEELFEINTAEELFLRLEEYRQFKEKAQFFKICEDEQQKIYLRSTGGQKVMVLTRQESVYTIWEGAHHLSDIMLRFTEIAKTEEYTPIFKAVEDFMVADKTNYILDSLQKSKQVVSMRSFVRDESLWEVIITFIALLEMARQKIVNLLQESSFGTIYVSLIDEFVEKENIVGKEETKTGD